MTKVRLTAEEMMTVALWGSRRRLRRLHSRDLNGFGQTLARWGADIEGLAAEAALAKALDIWFVPHLDWESKHPPGDVAGYEVRQSPRPDASLIVYPRERDAATFVLVTGLMPEFQIRGACQGGYAKQPQWWRENAQEPAYFVPQSALAPIEGLGVAA